MRAVENEETGPPGPDSWVNTVPLGSARCALRVGVVECYDQGGGGGRQQVRVKGFAGWPWTMLNRDRPELLSQRSKKGPGALRDHTTG